jgi:hypothetical protein
MIKMCKTHNPRKIDSCMKEYINFLMKLNLIPRSCCCGHGKYHKSVIVETTNIMGEVTNYELFTGKIIPRKKRFYVKDKQGYYFIPEIRTKRN